MSVKSLSPPVSIRVESAIYEAALALEADEREIFLERTFRDDPAGLAQMREMIERTGDSSAFFMEAREHRSFLAGSLIERIAPESLPQPAVAPAPLGEKPGSRIGPYRLLARIGEGGCGVIYEAEQEEPVRRRVALKIIRLGMDTENVIARFEVERQALALMDHPNIARVFDAGAAATGRPYFVMELVGGEKITACCDHERLDLVARIHLFIQVCHAIQHAHQKGIIHRDIKPSNVLVTFHDGVPVPKVIDFGIAKAVSGPPGGRTPTRWTSRDELIGTPAYMSPEQVEMNGLDVDTRSDIYSLGALLHELLVGRAPFDGHALAHAGLSRLRQTILESESPAPSKMLTALPPDELAAIAADRVEEPARLVARLRGDLDWIIATAMAKDRNRRYQTANALAADLRRFLANEPVTARRPGRFYLLGKFFRRHRAACISAAAITLSLVGGLGASTRLYLREREARAAQERLGHEAEAARANEARLRAQAQARANVSQAAALLADGRIEEADALLQESPVETIEPSYETAGVFRTLGNWNAIYGRWSQAAQCYLLLNQANRLENPAHIIEGPDVLTIGPALLEAGDRQAYERFRREALDLYLPVKNAIQAEHLLKVCLLTPADAGILDRLHSAADVCIRHVPAESDQESQPYWEALALAIYYHRLEDSAKTLEWGKKCLSYPDGDGPRAATALCLVALAHHRAGDSAKAAQNLSAAHRLIVEAPRDEPPRGQWFSWSIARLFENEAQIEMQSGTN